MLYRKLGQTKFRPSVIGIGTWQFGGEWGVQFSQAEVDAILDAADGAGINFIDTAECYGPDHLSERLIGDYLSRRDRSRWIIATKFGHHFNGFLNRTDDFSISGVQAQLDASLKALRVDSIDLYQFHSGSDALFQDEPLWNFLARQKTAGKIQALGLSILQKGSALQAGEAARYGVEALQVFYNRLDRRPEQLYFPAARQSGLGIIGRVPLASGLLTGKYQAGVTFAPDDVRSKMDADKLQRDLAEIIRLQQEELPPGVSLPNWAIAWCLEDPLVATVVCGCKNPAQVKANAHSATLLKA
ncbi:MAG: aldo/keto reductase [Verrucomicrobiota bacterium]